MSRAKWESRLIEDGGGICRYCGNGCKCGKCVCDQGTCVYCGHGMPIEVGEATALHPLARWITEASMIRAVRVWVRATGFPPQWCDWASATEEHPSVMQVNMLFGRGGWWKLLEAAGCEGRYPKAA